MPIFPYLLQCGWRNGVANLSEVPRYVLGNFTPDDHDGVRNGGNSPIAVDVCFPFQIPKILLSKSQRVRVRERKRNI